MTYTTVKLLDFLSWGRMYPLYLKIPTPPASLPGVLSVQLCASSLRVTQSSDVGPSILIHPHSARVVSMSGELLHTTDPLWARYPAHTDAQEAVVPARPCPA